MGRESREIWQRRVERWRDSGLSAKEFAAEVGVKESSLRNWGWRLKTKRAAAAPATVKPAKWVEFVVPAKSEAAALELVLASGLTVRVPAGFEAETLRRLLAVVG